MFKQIKALREESSGTAEELGSLKKEMIEFRESINLEKANMEELRHLQVDYVEKFKKNLDELKFVHDHVEKQLRQFTALSNEMSRVIGQNVDIDKHRKLKDDVAITAQNLTGLNQKIADLADIAREIKKSDFELSSYVQEVRREASKKLQLMQEVEHLKSQMAKMKRSGPKY